MRPYGRLNAALLLFCSMVMTNCSSVSDWTVRTKPGSPGNGCWNGSRQAVRVGENGEIRLRLDRIGGQWCQAEIRANTIASYGRHRFHVISRLDHLHPAVVLGMFLYADDEHEIDIEMSRSLAGADNRGVYAVQPARGDRVHKFPVELTGTFTTHEIDWTEDRIRFSSWHGHCEAGPCGGWIQQWVYEGPDIPVESDGLEVRMNLWLKGQDEPTETQEVVLRYAGVSR